MKPFAPDSRLVARVLPSPNHGGRMPGKAIDCVVLHYTGMLPGMALPWLCDSRSQVSCHYFVAEHGEILQLTPEERRAWHAGASCWAGERDVNSRSIGIEIDNSGHSGGLPPFPPAQIAAVVALCRDLCDRHAIAPQRVLAHSDIAPRRKIDPGEAFPWDALYRAGVGHWVAPAAITKGAGLGCGDSGEAVEGLRAALARYGYDVARTGAYDAEVDFVVRAFQRRFRPARIDGIADASTIATLGELLGTLPQPGPSGATGANALA